MCIAIYQDSGSGPLQKWRWRSTCAKTVEVDHFTNIDRYVPRQLKLTTAEMYIDMDQDSGNGPLQRCTSRCAKTMERDHC
ncbi:hypothetical protein PoB_004407700 [Plakobranchus ocellatus]|uniref:Uncharacterized protein n=1 Tax=Plakobranchus ocellatus TaxID=259542 RepID=A0AAV4BDQ0_9GAST|nr:hypothetical protein PoB_004407700 [Plakobranchus ocellatus]